MRAVRVTSEMLLTQQHPMVPRQRVAGELEEDLRFGDDGVLREKLRVGQGYVTPFGLCHDEKGSVTFVCDQILVDGSYKSIFFHPFVASASTAIGVQDFLTFLEATGHGQFKTISF